MITMSATVIGSAEAIQHTTQLTWTYNGGEVEVDTWSGAREAIEEKYAELKTVAGTTPTYDSIDCNIAKGRATVTARKTIDATGQVLYGATPGTTVELVANQVQKPIYEHSAFASLSAAMIQAVRRYFEEGVTVTLGETIRDALKQSVGTASQAAVDLYGLMCRGTEYYLEAQYVLRYTQTVSKRSMLQIVHTNVNRVDSDQPIGTMPDVSAVNTLIGALPSGEWLKMPPQVRQYGNNKWQIVNEWWWAEKWSAKLYGGTATP